MKLLITGAFGNLGLMCVDQALSMEYEVVCLDLDTRANRKIAASYANRVEVVLGDLRDASLVRGTIEDVDAIVHNAAVLPPVTETAPDFADEINVTACKALIAASEASAKKPVFVFPSSVTVFGLAQVGETPRTPTDPVHPTDNYTRHKIAIEKRLETASIPWVVLRVGVSVDARTLSTDRNTFRQLLAVRPDNPFEYVHPKDVALAMCRAASSFEARNRILLLGGGPSCRINQRQFLGTAFDALGIPLPAACHGSDGYYTHWMDTTESQALLRFQQHDFADYQKEMRDRLRTLRIGLWPLRWLLRPLLPMVLRRL